jgi:hypothetical protein
MKKMTLLFFFILLIPVHPHLVFAGSAQEISEKIQQLKDPSRPDSEKWEISREIQASGKAALPFLIGCVKDPTHIGKTPLTGGECVNLPAYLPIPPQCQNPLRTETLGDRCELLLYNILTPAYTSPYMTPLTSKQAPPRPFVIPDWEKWWKKHEKESFEEIHQEARKKIDEFWLNNHQKSVVWE